MVFIPRRFGKLDTGDRLLAACYARAVSTPVYEDENRLRLSLPSTDAYYKSKVRLASGLPTLEMLPHGATPRELFTVAGRFTTHLPIVLPSKNHPLLTSRKPTTKQGEYA